MAITFRDSISYYMKVSQEYNIELIGIIFTRKESILLSLVFN